MQWKCLSLCGAGVKKVFTTGTREISRIAYYECILFAALVKRKE